MAVTRSSDALSTLGFRLALASVAVCAFSFCFVLPMQAQSLGDLARQERERKAAQPAREAHVYTNDDLEHAHILVPEDQARAQATRVQARAAETADAAAGMKPAITQPEPTAVPTIVQTIVGEKVEDVSLGEVARRYRAQRDLKESLAAQNLAKQAPQQTAAVIEHPIQPSAPPLAYPSVGSSLRPAPTEPAQIQRVFQMAESARATSAPAPKPAYRASASEAASSSRAVAPPEIAERDKTSGSPADVREPAVNGVSEAHRPAAARPAQNPPGDEAQRQREVSADDGAADSAHVLVHRGDTLWGLAREFLGCGKEWPTIAAANPGLRSPFSLRVGTLLSVPSPFSTSAEPKLARLQPGDAFSSLAGADLQPAGEPTCPASATATIDSIHRGEIGRRMVTSETCYSSSTTRLPSALFRSLKRPG